MSSVVFTTTDSAHTAYNFVKFEHMIFDRQTHIQTQRSQQQLARFRIRQISVDKRTTSNGWWVDSSGSAYAWSTVSLNCWLRSLYKMH